MDGAWCGDQHPLALAQVRVPVYHLGAAGGFGAHARFTTEQLGSRDVTFRVVRRLAVAAEAEDFGHANLLYASDAPTLAWRDLAAWIEAH